MGSSKYLANEIVTNERVQGEITESLKSEKKKLYLLVMGIVWKWQMLMLGKMCLFESYCLPVLTYGIAIWMWTKGYNSKTTAAEVSYKKYRTQRQKGWGGEVRTYV